MKSESRALVGLRKRLGLDSVRPEPSEGFEGRSEGMDLL